MRKISVHFKNILVAVRQRVMEPGNVCCTQSLFAGSLQDVKLAAMLLLEILNNIRGAIRRTVIHNEDVERLRKRKYSRKNGFNIFFFVVRGYYDD